MKSTCSAIALTLLCASSSFAGGAPPAPAPAAADKDSPLRIPLTTSSADAKAQFLKGWKDAEAGRPDEARVEFDAAIKADASFALAYIGAATVAQTMDGGQALIKKASELAAKASPAEQAWIETFVKSAANDAQGNIDASLKFTKAAPTEPRAWISLGDAYGGLNKMDDSRTAYKKAIEVAPQAAIGHAALGNSYLNLAPRDFALAESEFKKVVEIEPKNAMSHDFLGDAYRALNKLKEARDSYSKGIELEPKNAGLYQQRGHANSFLGDAATARADYDKAMSLTTSLDRIGWLLFRANVSLYEGKVPQAIDEYKKGAAASAKEKQAEMQVDFLYNVALIAGHSGNFKDARAALDESAPIEKDLAAKATTADAKRGFETRLAWMRGYVAARQGDAAGVKSSVDELTKLQASETNPRKAEGLHELNGYLALSQKKYADAVTELKQADLNSIYVRYELATAYEGAGNADDAKKLYKEVAIFNFNGTDFALVRADAVAKAK